MSQSHAISQYLTYVLHSPSPVPDVDLIYTSSPQYPKGVHSMYPLQLPTPSLRHHEFIMRSVRLRTVWVGVGVDGLAVPSLIASLYLYIGVWM